MMTNDEILSGGGFGAGLRMKHHIKQAVESASLAEHLRAAGLPPLAIQWLVDLFNVFHHIDDVADGDQCDYRDLVLRLFCGIQQNPWYQANAHLLAPVVATQSLKWLAANNLEREGEHLEKAFMWRAGFYDIVLYVASIHGVADEPEKFAKLYGEKITEYMEEIRCLHQ